MILNTDVNTEHYNDWDLLIFYVMPSVGIIGSNLFTKSLHHKQKHTCTTF